MNFIFWFFLVGFFIASLQDLKRREVDNWLNLFLFFSGFIYIIFEVLLYNEISFLINLSFLVVFMFGLVNLFYFLKIFAGGDCKLLFAITPLFISLDFITSLQNILFFCLALFFIGAIYGLLWIIGLFIKDFKRNINTLIFSIKYKILLAIFLLICLLLSFINPIFIYLFFLSLFLVFVLYISRVVEKNSLVKITSPKNLREGDWLETDLIFRGRKIESKFEGLSKSDIGFLRKYSLNVKIKDGIPYAPVFLFTWVLFYFRGLVMEFLALFLGF